MDTGQAPSIQKIFAFPPGCSGFESCGSSYAWLLLKLLNFLRIDDKKFFRELHTPASYLRSGNCLCNPAVLLILTGSMWAAHELLCENSRALLWGCQSSALHRSHYSVFLQPVWYLHGFYKQWHFWTGTLTGSHQLVTVRLFLDKVLPSEAVRKLMVILSCELSLERKALLCATPLKAWNLHS